MKILLITTILLSTSIYSLFRSNNTNPEQFQTLEKLFPEVSEIHYNHDTLVYMKAKPIPIELQDFFPEARNSQFSRIGPDDYYAIEQIKSVKNTKLLLVGRHRSYEPKHKLRYFLYVFNQSGEHFETIGMGNWSNMNIDCDGKKLHVKSNEISIEYAFAENGKVTKGDKN